LPVRTVTVGRETTFKLFPHLNEFDAEALVSRHLSYEKEVFSFLDDRISSYDCVIEIGANVGIFTLYFAQNVRQVFAFEPSAKAYFRLLQNLSANHVENVTAFNCAVSDKMGLACFYEPEGHLTNGSLDPAFARNFSAFMRASTVLTVSGEVLNELAGEGKRILIKIDVEGAEGLVLKSMASFIALRRPAIIMEVLPTYAKELNSLAVFDRYSRFSLTPDGPVPRDNFQAERHRDYLLLPEDDLST